MYNWRFLFIKTYKNKKLMILNICKRFLKKYFIKWLIKMHFIL